MARPIHSAFLSAVDSESVPPLGAAGELAARAGSTLSWEGRLLSHSLRKAPVTMLHGGSAAERQALVRDALLPRLGRRVQDQPASARAGLVLPFPPQRVPSPHATATRRVTADCAEVVVVIDDWDATPLPGLSQTIADACSGETAAAAADAAPSVGSRVLLVLGGFERFLSLDTRRADVAAFRADLVAGLQQDPFGPHLVIAVDDASRTAVGLNLLLVVDDAARPDVVELGRGLPGFGEHVLQIEAGGRAAPPRLGALDAPWSLPAQPPQPEPQQQPQPQHKRDKAAAPARREPLVAAKVSPPAVPATAAASTPAAAAAADAAAIPPVEPVPPTGAGAAAPTAPATPAGGAVEAVQSADTASSERLPTPPEPTADDAGAPDIVLPAWMPASQRRRRTAWFSAAPAAGLAVAAFVLALMLMHGRDAERPQPTTVVAAAPRPPLVPTPATGDAQAPVLAATTAAAPQIAPESQVPPKATPSPDLPVQSSGRPGPAPAATPRLTLTPEPPPVPMPVPARERAGPPERAPAPVAAVARAPAPAPARAPAATPATTKLDAPVAAMTADGGVAAAAAAPTPAAVAAVQPPSTATPAAAADGAPGEPGRALARALSPLPVIDLRTQGSRAAAELSRNGPPTLAVLRYDTLQALPASRPLQTLRLVAPLFVEPVQVWVRADSPLQHLHQLRGRVLDVGAADGGNALAARGVYEALFGAPLPAQQSRNLDGTIGVAALQAGRVDALLRVGSTPPAPGLRALTLDAADASTARALRRYLPSAITGGRTLGVMSFLASRGANGDDTDQLAGNAMRELCKAVPQLRSTGGPAWAAVRPDVALPAGRPYANAALQAAAACGGAGAAPTTPVQTSAAMPLSPTPETKGALQ